MGGRSQPPKVHLSARYCSATYMNVNRLSALTFFFFFFFLLLIISFFYRRKKMVNGKISSFCLRCNRHKRRVYVCVCVLCVYICKLWHKAYAWFVYLRLQCTVTGAHMHELIWSCIRNKRGDDVMISVHHPILRTLSTTKRTTVRWHRPIVSGSI